MFKEFVHSMIDTMPTKKFIWEKNNYHQREDRPRVQET